MRLIPKRRRCKNFSFASSPSDIETMEREGRQSPSTPLSENESPPAQRRRRVASTFLHTCYVASRALNCFSFTPKI